MSSTAAYQRIAIAGGTGALGTPILTALVNANFSITLLTREGSTSQPSIPSGADVTIKSVDYTSTASITHALRGTDALVITIATSALSLQTNLIDAAIAAGVRRVIPSEFGCDTYNARTRKLPVFGQKVVVQEHLAKKASEDPDFSYTVIMNNAFFDWFPALAGFLVDIPKRKADLYDGGDRPFSVTRLSSVGQGVVGVLQHPAETRNKTVYIHDGVVTQNRLIRIAEKAGAGRFDTKVVDLGELEKSSYEALSKAKDDEVMGIMYTFLRVAIFRDGYGGEFKKVDNELLGVEMISEGEIEAIVKTFVSGSGGS